MPDQQPAQLATIETIAAHTLLTIDEIRSCVKSGHIPKPEGGRYRLIEAIKGAFRWRKEEAEKPWTVDKDILRNITGLSDQRHRQLANEGHFPAPIKGRYELLPTISGFIRYLKELHRKDKGSIGEKQSRKLDNQNLFLELRNGKTLDQIVEDFCSCISPALVEAKQIILASKLPEDQANELISALGKLIDNALKYQREVAPVDKAETSDTDTASEAQHLAMG